ncbi:MAG: peptidase domain-containing ABC transporter [Prevotella sp.]|nr:peptidase domain-containing ABC transporter [Prevotella sp.]
MHIIKYPIYEQYDQKDCGPTCLRMIAKFYGQEYSLDFLREKSYQHRTGTNFRGLCDAAEYIGMEAIPLKLTWEEFSQCPLPSIVQWKKNHFVVVYKITKRKVWVADPNGGLLKYAISAFIKCWSSTSDDMNNQYGICMLLSPTPEFYINKENANTSKKVTFNKLANYLFPYKKYFITIVLALIVGSILNLLFPLLTQTIVDVGINNKNINFIIVILLAQLMLTIGSTANNLVRNWLMIHVTSRISLEFISDFLRKLMKLPISFFDKKQIGDISLRIKDFNRIQSFLTSTLISLIVAILTFSTYAIIMGGYSLPILLIFTLGSFLYILWVTIFLKKRKKLDYMLFQETINSQDNIIQTIEGMQEIKLNNSEEHVRKDWEYIQSNLFNINIKSLSLTQIQQLGSVFIDQFKNILITFTAASSVINDVMSLGTMLSIQYIIGQLNAPVYQFVTLMHTYQDAKVSLERMNEVYVKPDESEKTGELTSIPTNANIELKNVTFQYGGPHSRKVLNDINLMIESNKITAIVGHSGCGKTTLLKLILGHYPPTQGEILLGGIPLNRFNVSEWRKRCATVMQEGTIFSYDISRNISLMDEYPNMERVKNAADIANIKDFIERLPLKYNTAVGKSGVGLSTGQKQRLLIARAAYKDAEYIIFDEATNSLDTDNEYNIMKKLNEFFKGKTVIIVAHRLSTVRNADKIVVLDNGRIAEVGNHEQLISLKGSYYNLIKNQLNLNE